MSLHCPFENREFTFLSERVRLVEIRVLIESAQVIYRELKQQQVRSE